MLSNIKKQLLNWLSPNSSCVEEQASDEIMDVETLQEEEKKQQEQRREFKLNNIVFDKLNYLEQYIKIFSLTFRKEYDKYLMIIKKLRKDYEEELEKYRNGLEGNITFSIDPEHETRRYVEVINLQTEIEKFVENEVNYKVYKDKFSKLCSKFNIFYNALIDTSVTQQVIKTQLDNASNSLGKIVKEVKIQEFFETDTRKKEKILNYIIYGEYIIFKSFLRCSMVNNFEKYKQELSEFYSLFNNAEYDCLMFRFFIEDLEQLQIFITDNLKNESTYQYILDSCEKLQNRLDNYTEVFDDDGYFEELIRFENTIDTIAKNINLQLSLNIPSILDMKKSKDGIISINNIAVSILNLIDNEKAKLLLKIIDEFTLEISWREFYFLCKVFELYDELVEMSNSTIFTIIKDKFLKLENKYKEYSDSYIQEEKEKILSYNGTKSKKYILLITIDTCDIAWARNILEKLSLDFRVVNNDIYLNHSYFNGFKNLEANFGMYKIF